MRQTRTEIKYAVGSDYEIERKGVVPITDEISEGFSLLNNAVRVFLCSFSVCFRYSDTAFSCVLLTNLR